MRVPFFISCGLHAARRWLKSTEGKLTACNRGDRVTAPAHTRQQRMVVGIMPTLDILQVQHLVSYAMALVGDLVNEVSSGFSNFGSTVGQAAADANAMAMLTTGIFGTHSGLVYWINNKVFYLIENFPWCDLGQGLGVVLRGLINAPPCP